MTSVGRLPAVRLSGDRIRLHWAGFAFLYLAFALLAAFSGVAEIVDERVHYFQISLFDHGDLRVARDLIAMLPGYHALMAILLSLCNVLSLPMARLINATIALGTIFAFHRLHRGAHPDAHSWTTLQFALLPLLFPYDFLVYTDVLSLGLVMAALAATMAARDWTALALMLAAMCVRQTNVVWMALAAAIAFMHTRMQARAIAARLAPYAIGVGAFVAFWLWNGRVSLSPQQEVLHPEWSFHAGNLYFALAICAVLLPLHVVHGLRRFVGRVRARPGLLLLPAAILAFYYWQFRIDHPYNQLLEPFTLHNYVLQGCLHHPVARHALGFLATAAACGLASARLQPSVAWVLFPLSAFLLAASWMIEPRYALAPLALWLAFREPFDRRTEAATTALWAVFSVSLTLSMFVWHFAP